MHASRWQFRAVHYPTKGRRNWVAGRQEPLYAAEQHELPGPWLGGQGSLPLHPLVFPTACIFQGPTPGRLSNLVAAGSCRICKTKTGKGVIDARWDYGSRAIGILGWEGVDRALKFRGLITKGGFPFCGALPTCLSCAKRSAKWPSSSSSPKRLGRTNTSRSLPWRRYSNYDPRPSAVVISDYGRWEEVGRCSLVRCRVTLNRRTALDLLW